MLIYYIVKLSYELNLNLLPWVPSHKRTLAIIYLKPTRSPARRKMVVRHDIEQQTPVPSCPSASFFFVIYFVVFLLWSSLPVPGSLRPLSSPHVRQKRIKGKSNSALYQPSLPSTSIHEFDELACDFILVCDVWEMLWWPISEPRHRKKEKG